MQEDPFASRPYIAMKMQDRQTYESVWFCILNLEEKEVTHAIQIDLQEEELQNIRSVKIARCSKIDQISKPSAFQEDILPSGCNREFRYQVCVWFGDDKWVLKIFEYRVRWFDNI